jgi:hypothetical protein
MIKNKKQNKEQKKEKKNHTWKKKRGLSSFSKKIKIKKINA